MGINQVSERKKNEEVLVPWKNTYMDSQGKLLKNVLKKHVHQVFFRGGTKGKTLIDDRLQVKASPVPFEVAPCGCTACSYMFLEGNLGHRHVILREAFHHV